MEEIEEKSWLMKSSLHYFRLNLKNQEKGVIFAVSHSNICRRWLYHFNLAIRYLEFAPFIKPVLPADQVVESLDDKKG